MKAETEELEERLKALEGVLREEESALRKKGLEKLYDFLTRRSTSGSTSRLRHAGAK